MDEVTPLSVVAVAFFREGVAGFGLVGSITFHVDSKFFGPVGELALLAVGAVALFGEVFAEGSLGFGAEGRNLAGGAVIEACPNCNQ